MTRAIVSRVDHAIDVTMALFFFLVIAPPVWLWHKGRRPMWRMLTRQQTKDLQAWLKTTASR